MKLSPALASILLLPVAVAAHPSSTTNAAKRTATPRSVSSELPASLPLGLTTSPESAPTGPGAITPTLQPSVPATETEREPLPELSSPLAWTAPVLSLREIPVTPARRSRHTEAQGVFPRAARSPNPGFTGFLVGIGNLFNPFAPASLGVETSGENWYDSSVRSNPLPWGLRDERFHEPQTSEFSTELSRLLSLGGARNEPPASMPVLQGPLLTHRP
jgi:hypothetical protein